MDVYKARENQCNKKWSDLLNENNSNKEKINLISKEISDQKEQFNNLLAENDDKLIDSLNKIPLVIKLLN